MQSEQRLQFHPYRLDPRTGQLWRGKQEVKVTPKAAAVLCQLVARAGQVVTKAELFQTVWKETVVSDAALSSCIQELRRVLHDQARSPRYIETGHGRGYRFLPAVTTTSVERGAWSVKRKGSSPAPVAPRSSLSVPRLVGRDAELSQLHGWLDKALSGERQLVFVTGEAGIGKTTLVEAFLSEIRGPRSQEENQRAQGKNQKAKVEDQVPTPSLEPLAPGLWLARGQCIEHYGAGEAYLPILEALGRLCREEDGKEVIALLRQHAPSWLVQMPSLLSPAEFEELQRRTVGVTRERMLRELAEALEVITQERPLVLVLEDLHWSDVSTLDLLSMLARRQERAQLLLIGTYRPVDVMVHEHPLKVVKQELHLHGRCQELALDFLSEEAVTEYLTVRFALRLPHPGSLDKLRTGSLPQGEREPITAGTVQKLARMVRQRTDGNPLFMINVTNELVARGIVTQHNERWTLQGKIDGDGIGVPENLRQLIEQQIERVSPEAREVLEAASVVGAEFSVAAVAVALKQEMDEVETICEEVAGQGHFLEERGIAEWPDGTISGRYGFRHALYQNVLSDCIAEARRIRLHRLIGERVEAGYGERAEEVATELAVHFERGHDYRRAVQYYEQAGKNAIRRSAHREAINHLTKGLELLKTLPDTPDHARQELMLQIALGTPLQATKGIAALETEQAYTRARELCQQLGEIPQLFPVLFNLWLYYNAQGEYTIAATLGRQLLSLAEQTQDAALFLEAHHAMWTTACCLGDFVLAREHLEQGRAIYHPQQHHTHAFLYGGHDPGVCGRGQEALILWSLGYPDQALGRTREARALADELSHPMSLAVSLSWTTIFHQLRRNPQTVQEHAEAMMALSSEQGFPFLSAWGTILQGWALAEQGHHEEGIARMRHSLTGYRTTGAKLLRVYFLALLAEACAQAGQIEEGLAVLVEALDSVDKTGERFYEAELYRLKGELRLQEANQKSKGKSQKAKVETNPQSLTPNPQGDAEREAEECFQKAVEVAQRQQAKSLELRATVSLARLWQQQGKYHEACNTLSEIYHWFTEGFDTKDLQEAKALIEELSHLSAF